MVMFGVHVRPRLGCAFVWLTHERVGSYSSFLHRRMAEIHEVLHDLLGHFIADVADVVCGCEL
jgi:hypothetical protein